MKIRFPSISSLRSCLADEQKSLRRSVSRDELQEISEPDSVPSIDLRLRVTGSGWQILTGSSDYDQDHRGFWGSSYLPYDRANLTEIARDLIEQAKEHEAMQS
jgi:hypothetical protein